MGTLQRVTRRVVSARGDLIALALGFTWFMLNVSLPGVYRGKVCCDSIGYRNIARDLGSISDILTHYDYRPLGYPLFLRLHLTAVQELGLGQFIDWVDSSLFTAFA